MVVDLLWNFSNTDAEEEVIKKARKIVKKIWKEEKKIKSSAKGSKGIKKVKN